MTAGLHDPLQHARRILDVVAHGARDRTSEAVANSWTRCLNEHRLDPGQSRRPPVLERAELATRHARAADVIDCARHEMSTLYQQLGDADAAVVLTDAAGVILHMVASPEFERAAAPLGLQVGAVWSEAEAGTNGMGTCVAAAGPIAVQLDDHFFARYTSLTCSAVPVRDPAGEVAAVLDVTSRSRLAQQHLLVLLDMTARMIENRLLDARFRDAHPVRFHSRPEFVYTLHEGKLIVADDGRVLAANRSALMQLGLGSVREVRARRFDQLFQASLDDMLERSHRALFHPVVAYGANGAHRFFAVARQPARNEGAGHHPAGPASRDQLRREPSRCDAPTACAAAAVAPPATFADARLQAHLATARRVVARGTPVLLRGETGAGKEVFARAVHEGSPRAHGPFVPINCASLPESLIEAELFGYRAGAFTGAERSGRRGRIAQADGGTLFLDEIGDMPLALQARLLRVLDERMVTPLGMDEARPVDFQLVSASHRSLDQLVGEGRFREDLYYRLAGIELVMPALRERTDRADLIRAMLAAEGAPDAPIVPAAWDLLMSHPWPGNVRQLRHAIRSAVALADGAALTLEHLPSLRAGAASPGQAARCPGLHGGPPTGSQAGVVEAADALAPQQVRERQALLEALEAQRWNVSHVARALGVSRNTLYRRMHRLHIPVTHADGADCADPPGMSDAPAAPAWSTSSS